MFKKIAFLRRSIISDPHLWIAFVVLFIFLALDLLHALHWLPWEVPQEGLFSPFGLCHIHVGGRPPPRR
jgi:hypothetical protein